MDKIHELALRYYEAHDSAHSLTCAILLRYREWDQLAKRATDPNDFNCPDSYRKAVFPNDLLRKLEQLPTTIDKREAAIQKWKEAEEECFWTNLYLNNCLEGDNPSTPLINFLSAVKKTIREVLGPCPTEVELTFGPGATFLRRGNRCMIPDKISCPPEMSGGAWIFVKDFLESAWSRSLSGTLFNGGPQSLSVDSVPGNRLTTVPKDGKTDRAIAIEPSLNIAVQLGIGKLLRRRLNRIGLLLDNSQEVHREYARKGSIDDDLATIDLTSASDTVARDLVRHVLPNDWFELLDAARSPKTVFPNGRAIILEKFSSMGNGFTFELETLIFYAICKQFTDKVSVFGDDIVVPSIWAPAIIEALKLLGFSANTSKTFIRGPFRESCGGDFFLGQPVRAIFLKDLSSWDVPDLFTLHNLLARVGVKTCTDYVLSLIPKRYRNLGGPTILGDIVLHGVEPITKVKDGITYYRCLKLMPFRYPIERWDDGTAFTSILYGIDSEGISPRNPPVSYRVGWVPRS